jgi:protein associated with RNAse G/E
MTYEERAIIHCDACQRQIHEKEHKRKKKYIQYVLNVDAAIEKAVRKISNDHKKILDDFCMAYLACTYEKTGRIPLSEITLYEKDFQDGNEIGKKYWIELGR